MILRPMLATTSQVLPEGPGWTYEVKWDGYRVLAVKDPASVRLLSRNDKDLTRTYPAVVSAVAALAPARFVLDGEIVAIQPDGRPSFQALQHRSATPLPVVYYAFNLLALEGTPWVKMPLNARWRQLAAIVRQTAVLYSDALHGDVRTIERVVRGLHLEGIVAKREKSLYRLGERTEDWIKVRFSPRQEFVVGGYGPAGKGLESILVGTYDKGQLLFAAKVRAGLTPHLKNELFERICAHHVDTCPFVNLPNSTSRSRWAAGITEQDMTTLHWVRPRQVVEVSFVEWTREGCSGIRASKGSGMTSRRARSAGNLSFSADIAP